MASASTGKKKEDQRCAARDSLAINLASDSIDDIFSAVGAAGTSPSLASGFASNPRVPTTRPCILIEGDERRYDGFDQGSRLRWNPPPGARELQLLDFATKKHRALIPNLGQRKWLGGKENWMVVINEDLEMALIDLYTQREVKLPTLDPKGWGCEPDKVDLSEVPTAAANYEDYIVLSFSKYNNVAVATRRTNGWHQLKHDTPLVNRSTLSDGFCLSGKAYALNCQDGSLYIWDIAEGIVKDPTFIPPPTNGDTAFRFGTWRIAKMDHPEAVLAVYTYGRNNMQEIKPNIFSGHALNIFRLVQSAEGKNYWKQLENLANRSLFIGINHPMIVPIVHWKDKDIKEFLKPNSVYVCPWQWHELGWVDYYVHVYSLHSQDKEILTVFKTKAYEAAPRPMWIKASIKIGHK